MEACMEEAVASYFEYRIDDRHLGKSLAVRLNLDVVDRLATAVMEGFKAVPRRGLEVGGLLLGRIEADWVVVDDFAPIPSEHQYGPSWLLSGKDKKLLAGETSRLQAAADGLRVVGLCRSHTRSC